MSNNTLPYGFSIATARKVTPLRQRMIDDMTVRNFAPNTMLCYLNRSPTLLSILAGPRTA